MFSLTAAQKQQLQATANALVAPGKGVIPTGEDPVSLGKRLFVFIGIENTAENRRLFRQLLFTCDKSIGNYISGVILSNDTFSLRADDGVTFIQHLQDRGIVPGININQGMLPHTDDETTTEGVDGSGLANKCKQFHALGVRFAKLRCVLKMGSGGGGPSQSTIDANANTLAHFASICQANDLTVIVEVDPLSGGSHDLESSHKVVQRTLSTIYKALGEHHVYLEGTVIKPCMVVPSGQFSTQYTQEQIAEATVSVENLLKHNT